MINYDIDFDQFILENLPIEQRQPVMIKWLKVLFKPMAQVDLLFKNFRSESLYKVNHNSQICYLRAVLNDAFDKHNRRIKIANATLKEPVWFYDPLDEKPVYFKDELDNLGETIEPIYFRDESELIGSYDFLVTLPMALLPSTRAAELDLINNITALLNYYKLFVKEAKIVFE